MIQNSLFFIILCNIYNFFRRKAKIMKNELVQYFLVFYSWPLIVQYR